MPNDFVMFCARYTFKFDRFMKVDSAVIDKLRKARDTASVVCANPTSIKSFYLKFIEIMHYIDQTVVSAKMDKQLEASKSLFSRFKVQTRNQITHVLPFLL